jgi:WS/DGAT/MGAT family acyltransferase
MSDRLSPTDAAFLYSEDATTPMHVGGVVILHPTGGFDFQRVVELVASRLALVPRYRQKVRFVPGRLARPVWIDDDSFDITYHVRRSALPRPGTREQLEELVGRLISRPLDRSRPLWELYIVEGLEGGRVALVNKTHETMVDRIGAVDVAAAILDLTRSPRELPATPWIPVPAPSEVDLVVDAISDLTARPTDVVDSIRLAALDLRSTAGGVLDAGLSIADVLRRTVSHPQSSPLTVRSAAPRRFATGSADLAQVKAIRRAHGGSVNDVILAVIAGALRSWLLSRGDPVSVGTSPRALVPVSVRGDPPDDSDDTGQVSSFVVDLPVAEPNAVMRLHQVSFAMTGLMESGRPIGAATLLDLGRLAPPTLHAMGARVAGQLSRRSYDMLITNVPGPQVRLYAAGIPVEEMYPIAPLARGHALAVACTSYHGRVFFGVTSDRDAMPEVQEFGLLIAEALAELVDTVPVTRSRRTGDRVRGPATRPAPSRSRPRPAVSPDRG